MKNSTNLATQPSFCAPRALTHLGFFALSLAFSGCGGAAGPGNDPDGGIDGTPEGDGMGGESSVDGTPGSGGDTSGVGGMVSTGGSDDGTGGSDDGTGGSDDGTGGSDGSGGTCEADQHVDQGGCVACPAGTTAAAGAEVVDGDTECSSIVCGENEFVADHGCSVCPEGSVNEAGDDASGDDTTCETVACAELVSLIPVMSQNDEDFGTAMASGIFDTSYPAWHAFDGTGSLWLSEYQVSPAWLSYEFKTGPEVVEQYTIQYTNGPTLVTRAPKNWKFEAWNGSSWLELDARNGETGWTSGEERAFSIASPAAYSKYRLHVTQDNDHREDIVTVSIGQMKLLGSACACDTTPVAQIPTMGSLDDDAGTATASGVYSQSYPAWQAFDGTNSLWLSQENVAPAWIAYEFKDGARHITQYSITYANGHITTRAPRDFTLQGYDGVGWVTLDTRTNQTSWSAGGETRIFDVASPGDYSKYRLHITQDNDNRADIIVASVGEFQLIGDRCGE